MTPHHIVGCCLKNVDRLWSALSRTVYRESGKSFLSSFQKIAARNVFRVQENSDL